MPPQPDENFRLKAKVFYALSDPVRLEILAFLRDGEKCVCEVVPHLNLIQPVVSRHLRILKDSGLVADRKDGNKRMYSITQPEIYDVVDALTPELSDRLLQRMLDRMACR
jgi:DNA-binding transcriptional ArsR family regulator